MCFFTIGIEHPFDVTVQRRSLPFRRGVLGLGQLRDVLGGIPQVEELLAIWKRYWILKRGGPGQ